MRCVRLRDGTTEPCGRLIDDDAEGVEAGPTGGDELRQVVQEGSAWAAITTWIARDGTAYDRHWCPFAGEHRWAAAPKAIRLESTCDEFSVLVGSGSARRSVRLLRAIALAWVEAPRTSAARLCAAVLPGREPTAEHIVWVRAGGREVEDAGVRAVGDDPAVHGTWRPLQYVWRDGAGDVVRRVPPDDGYEVSSKGHLRSPYSSTTRGLRSVGQRRRASLAGGEVVWLDEAVLCSFTGLPSEAREAVHRNGDREDSRLENLEWGRTRAPVVRPLLADTVARVRDGATIRDICATDGVRRCAVWERLVQAAQELPLDDLLALRAVVPRSVTEWMSGALEAGDCDVSDTVTALRDACDEALSGRDSVSVWTQMEADDQFAVVRIGRALLVREATLRGAS